MQLAVDQKQNLFRAYFGNRNLENGVGDENPRCEKSCALQETDQLFGTTWLRDSQRKKKHKTAERTKYN